jgi:hypothetical protein
VDELTILRNVPRSCHGVHAIDVGTRDLIPADDDDPLRDHRLHVLAGDAGVEMVHTRPRHPLGVGERLLDGLGGLLDVGDDSASQARGSRLTNA